MDFNLEEDKGDKDKLIRTKITKKYIKDKEDKEDKENKNKKIFIKSML